MWAFNFEERMNTNNINELISPYLDSEDKEKIDFNRKMMNTNK